jgi:hypothetical protein
LDAARRIDNDEVILVRSANFLELRYELPQVSAMTQGANSIDQSHSLSARRPSRLLCREQY